MARKLAVLLALIIAGLFTVGVACGGGGTETTPQEETTPTQTRLFSFSIEQSDGVVLTLNAPPQRIVSLSSHFTEILCAIGAGEQLVAVERFANCPEGSQEKPELDAYEPNLEAIAGFEPDLVYVFSDPGGLVQGLRDLGIPVLFLELPTSLEGVLQQIELFGRMTGHEAEAQALVRELRDRIEAVRDQVADVEQGPRVFHELDTTYFTVGPGSFVDDLYQLLKAQNIAEETGEAYPRLSAEVIIERDPEVIVLADEPAGVTPESVRARPGWSEIAAVQNDRICSIDPDLLSVPGPRVVDGLEELARCLYPERFS